MKRHDGLTDEQTELITDTKQGIPMFDYFTHRMRKLFFSYTNTTLVGQDEHTHFNFLRRAYRWMHTIYSNISRRAKTQNSFSLSRALPLAATLFQHHFFPSVAISVGLVSCLSFFAFSVSVGLSGVTFNCFCLSPISIKQLDIVSLSLSRSVCLFSSLTVCLSICLSVDLSVYRSVCFPLCLSVYLSVCRSVCLSVCLSISFTHTKKNPPTHTKMKNLAVKQTKAANLFKVHGQRPLCTLWHDVWDPLS